jgi:DNA-directed RNA polymerase specialized sigma subunit
MQRIAAFLRDDSAALPMSARELDRRAREVVGAIDNETGSRTAHAQRVARLYNIARDIQNACEAGCGADTARKIIGFLSTVLMRSYLPRLAPR